MTYEQAINYFRSSGMSEEQIQTVVEALTDKDAVNRANILQKYEKYCEDNCPYSKKQRDVMCGSCMMGDAIEMVEDALPVTPKPAECEDAVSRADLLNAIYDLDSAFDDNFELDYGRCYKTDLDKMAMDLPPVTPKQRLCRDCKWWLDSDGRYRRGIRAESQCPINRKEVFEGNGYCFLFESEEGECE